MTPGHFFEKSEGNQGLMGFAEKLNKIKELQDTLKKVVIYQQGVVMLEPERARSFLVSGLRLLGMDFCHQLAEGKYRLLRITSGHPLGDVVPHLRIKLFPFFLTGQFIQLTTNWPLHIL